MFYYVDDGSLVVVLLLWWLLYLLFFSFFFFIFPSFCVLLYRCFCFNRNSCHCKVLFRGSKQISQFVKFSGLGVCVLYSCFFLFFSFIYLTKRKFHRMKREKSLHKRMKYFHSFKNPVFEQFFFMFYFWLINICSCSCVL